MKVVYKYPIYIFNQEPANKNPDVFRIELPAAAKIVSVGMDPATGCPAMWAIVDPEEPAVWRTFRVAGTGHDLRGHENHFFLGTAFCKDLVWHIFELVS